MWDDKGGPRTDTRQRCRPVAEGQAKGPLFQVRRHTCGPGSRQVWQSGGRLDAGWVARRKNRFSCPIGEKTFPFMFFKENRARSIGRFHAELCQMVDAPSHYHINGQTGLYALGCPQLSLFNLAAALEGFMINLDCPSTGSTTQPFQWHLPWLSLHR